MTKFGIVITTYQRKDGKTPGYLSRCLESIRDQSYQNYKVFLIGDRYESQDEFDNFGSGIIENEKLYKNNLEFAAERDFYGNNKNALWSYGGCNASNIGIDEALRDHEIEYICRLDHDDYWGKDHLQNFVKAIIEVSPDWMCSVSKYLNGELPALNDGPWIYPFLPRPESCIKSSTCINQRTIDLRTRDLYKETGRVLLPGDGDLWARSAEYILKNNLKSIVVNKLTCFHDEEGYSLK